MIGRGPATAVLLFALLGAWPIRVSAAADPTGAPDVSAVGEADAAAIQSIRDDLAGLRFEKIEAAAETLLVRPDLPESVRKDVLALRAQARASGGDFDGADSDYRTILAVQPSFVPDPAGTPRKALARFDKIRAATVGTLRFQIDPPDSRVVVDGRPVAAGADGLAATLAGDRQVRVERQGYDSLSFSVHVPAATIVPLQAQLVPNTRSVIVRTEPDGVEVRVDGALVGVTKRPAGEAGALAPGGTAELAIDYLPLGEHRFQLDKPCFHGQSFSQLLKVDLVDRAPKALDVVALEPARGRIVPENAPESAVLRVDGAFPIPLRREPVEICPGARLLEVLVGGRIVRRERVDVPESDDAVVDLSPRPGVALVGSAKWPEEFASWASAFDVTGELPLPADDPTRSETWDGVALPPDTDLAIAVLPAGAGDETPRWLVYSPVLRTVERVATAPAPDPPELLRNEIGVRLADARPDAGAIVAQVLFPGPAATAGLRAGQRISAVAGKPVSDSREARSAIAARAPAKPVEIRVVDTGGDTRTVTVVGAASPVLDDGARAPGAAAVLAAWAAVRIASGGEAAASAAANLALALSRAGRHAKAIEAWRRVGFGDRAGVGEGTAAYYAAESLLALGREAEAREMLLKARGSAATTFSDEGPEVAPAAADILRDLGVAGP